MSNDTPGQNGDNQDKPNILQVILSVLSAAFGVQSSKNRERDFKQGNFKIYAIIGLVFTILFIVSLVVIVKMVLKNAGL